MAIDCRSCLSIARSRRSLRRQAFPTPPAACSTSAMMSTTGVPVRGNAKTKATHELKRLVVVVVVVVRTRVYDNRVCPGTPTDAPNYGGRVPVDTTPGPCTCVQHPKNSPHQLINATMSCSSRRKPRQCNRWEHNCLLHDGTCGPLSTCTTGTSVTLSIPGVRGKSRFPSADRASATFT